MNLLRLLGSFSPVSSASPLCLPLCQMPAWSSSDSPSGDTGSDECFQEQKWCFPAPGLQQERRALFWVQGFSVFPAFGTLQESLSLPSPAPVASPALGVLGVFLSGCRGRIWAVREPRCSQAGFGPCRGVGAAATRKIEALGSQLPSSRRRFAYRKCSAHTRLVSFLLGNLRGERSPCSHGVMRLNGGTLALLNI